MTTISQIWSHVETVEMRSARRHENDRLAEHASDLDLSLNADALPPTVERQHDHAFAVFEDRHIELLPERPVRWPAQRHEWMPALNRRVDVEPNAAQPRDGPTRGAVAPLANGWV